MGGDPRGSLGTELAGSPGQVPSPRLARALLHALVCGHSVGEEGVGAQCGGGGGEEGVWAQCGGGGGGGGGGVGTVWGRRGCGHSVGEEGVGAQCGGRGGGTVWGRRGWLSG